MKSASNGGIFKGGLQVLHVHVLLVAPLGAGHMAQPGTDQHKGGIAVRESGVEEALIEMYLAGVSVRRVEDITEALWGSKVSPATISELNKKAYVHIEDWRNRPLQGGRYPYVYVDGIYLRRNWGGEYENVVILVAIAVNEDGFREVLGAAEGMKYVRPRIVQATVS